MDIPSIDKTIFLIDRKDLDTQTTMAFQAYANNDLVDVDETDNVNDLKKKLKSADRQVIVTTIQKMQILISKRLQEGTPDFDKIKNLRIAFVVDECHRAVTPKTKRELERFFGRSLWYGFTELHACREFISADGRFATNNRRIIWKMSPFLYHTECNS